MSLDLAFDDAQQAIAEALGQFCRDHCTDEVVKAGENRFPRELWSGIAALGVLALVTPEGDGGAVEMTAALEALGAAVFPGPIPATFLATQLVGEKERIALAQAEAVVSLGTPPLMPWAPAATLFVEVSGDADRAWLCTARGSVEPVSTLGGEPWGRVELERNRELDGLARGRVVHDIAHAAYLSAAARRLVEDTAEHARTRKQFGRAIGEFQSVAHPLADCSIQLEGAATLARAASFRFDSEHADAPATAGAARLAATRAAVHTARTCHQLFGAIGITLEGPVFHISRRIRQLASQPPDAAAARKTALASFGW